MDSLSLSGPQIFSEPSTIEEASNEMSSSSIPKTLRVKNWHNSKSHHLFHFIHGTTSNISSEHSPQTSPRSPAHKLKPRHSSLTLAVHKEKSGEEEALSITPNLELKLNEDEKGQDKLGYIRALTARFSGDGSQNLELSFVRSIQSHYRIVAELPITLAEREDLTRDRMHEVNCNTIEEACLGFRAVMTTEKFINALHSHFQEADHLRKMECFMIFNEWISRYHKLYSADFERKTTVLTIKAFIHALEEGLGKPHLAKVNKMLKKILAAEAENEILASNAIHDIHPIESKEASELSLWQCYIDYFHKDVDAIARDLLNETYCLQACIKPEIFASEKEEGKTLLSRIPEINNKIKECIIHDIFLEKSESNRVSKYKFYLSLFKHSMKLGNLYMGIALAGVFIDIAKNFTDVKRVKRLEKHVEKWTVRAGEKRGVGYRNELLVKKELPANLINLFNTIETLKAWYPPYIEEVGAPKTINANYVAGIAAIVKDIFERVEAIGPVESKSQLFQALTWA